MNYAKVDSSKTMVRAVVTLWFDYTQVRYVCSATNVYMST